MINETKQLIEDDKEWWMRNDAVHYGLVWNIRSTQALKDALIETGIRLLEPTCGSREKAKQILRDSVTYWDKAENK